jgi:tripartite-type tricarboxylate transporter receptor subunit TctC
VLALAGFAAHAQTWPSKPIIFLNPFPAGGGTDTFARPIAARLSQTLGQQVLIENQGGAGGTVGAANAAKRAPDGYNWFFGAVHHTIAESLYRTLPYGLEKDFEPITVAAFVPNVVVVHPKHADKFKTLKDLIEHAKANPGKLNYGSAGSGTTHHLSVELFKTMTKTFMVHIPYRGAGPLMIDLLAGQVDMAFDGMGTSAQQIKAGKLIPLAVTSAVRNPVLPNVPTVQEAGVPGYEVRTWYALWAIKGTPAEIKDHMYQDVVAAINHPDLKRIWSEQGADPGGMQPDEFARLVHSEIAKWAKVVKDAGAQVDN